MTFYLDSGRLWVLKMQTDKQGIKLTWKDLQNAFYVALSCWNDGLVDKIKQIIQELCNTKYSNVEKEIKNSTNNDLEGRKRYILYAHPYALKKIFFFCKYVLLYSQI